MIQISYPSMVILITTLWILNRITIYSKNKRINWRREMQLLLVYICLIVIIRFTFCPFRKVDSRIQPLIFYPDNYFPFRINWTPIVHLLDYPETQEILLNLIGNTVMFIPVGIVWPIVFKDLNKPWKVILAGILFSLLIEILQLPFYDRVSDIDDLILNSTGYIIGYGILRLIKACSKH